MAGGALEVHMLRAAVSGSFHRHMGAITAAVSELAASGVRVLSPAEPRIVARQGEFWFVASDPVRSVRLVQDRHLECIRVSNFLWLVCPDGYVGQSASMEIGYAAAVGVSIFAIQPPSDLTLRQYVQVVPTLASALATIETAPQPQHIDGLLIDPHASVERAHFILDQIGTALTRGNAFPEPARQVHDDLETLRRTVGMPSYAH
jgi:hypothetical protein